MSDLVKRIKEVEAEQARNVTNLHVAVLSKNWADIVALASVLMGLDCALQELRNSVPEVQVESEAVQLRKVILAGASSAHAALAITKALGSKTLRVAEIAKLLPSHGFVSKQKDTREYIRYVLSKNKGMFEKAGPGLYRNKRKRA